MDVSVESDPARLVGTNPPFWLTPPSYWLPPHVSVSAWHTHGPFAAWIVDALRPQRIVELGTHYGFSCFAFAEAAKRLGLATSISALDTWEGDDQAGLYGEEVYEFVARVAAADYPDSVSLVRGWFSESRRLFADASVDLLHIDGRHGYEDVRSDYDEWRSTVRDGGVILFHDIAERENGFGVWRLWDEISEPGRSFAFEHGHGLGVLGVGDVHEGPLGSLFSADEATAARIREDFSRLGEVVNRQVWLESMPSELERTRAQVGERSARIAELEATVADLQASLARQQDYIDSLRSSTSWRVTAPLRAVGKLRPHSD